MSWTVPTIILILQYLQTTAIKKEMKEKLQEIIDKLSALVPEIPGVPGIPPAPQVVVSIPQRANRYHIFELDTATARANVPLGLKEYLDKFDVKHATYMVVLAVGGGFTYRVNSGAESLCTAVVGDEWSEFEITEIFITNLAVAGTARIHVEYRVE